MSFANIVRNGGPQVTFTFLSYISIVRSCKCVQSLLLKGFAAILQTFKVRNESVRGQQGL